jgi:hypothetical protein
MATLDEVIETVRGAREDGSDALAAMALSYGATVVLGSVRIAVLRGQVLAAERAMEDARRGLAEVCAARDSARIRAERAESDAAQCRADILLHRNLAAGAVRERDAARADAARLRALPTYDARTTPPTEAEQRAHRAEGGSWLVSWRTTTNREVCEVRGRGDDLPHHGLYIPIDADCRPCAWPTP